jgi:hypothetical protein
VAETRGTDHGLWSTFLLQRSDGALQCYYDDETTPAEAGLPGHQWITMKTWDPAARAWADPVTVSRAFDRRHLSRDGMCTVVETAPPRLVCAFESVQTAPPHAGLLRFVTSGDGGATWSWSAHERAVLYQPADTRFNALAPWMVRLPDGTLLCVFTTDEDRPVPGVASRGRLYQDLKFVTGEPEGEVWSAHATPIDSDYPNLFPGLCLATGPQARPTLVLQYLNAQRGTVTRRGRLSP